MEVQQETDNQISIKFLQEELRNLNTHIKVKCIRALKIATKLRKNDIKCNCDLDNVLKFLEFGRIISICGKCGRVIQIE